MRGEPIVNDENSPLHLPLTSSPTVSKTCPVRPPLHSVQARCEVFESEGRAVRLHLNLLLHEAALSIEQVQAAGVRDIQ